MAVARFGLLLLACVGILSVAATTPLPEDLQVERVGVPFPSWSAPVYSNATPFNQNPQLTRHTHLAPRFHRLLRYGKDINSKSQTAIFVAGRSAEDEEEGRQGASIISALNPRNGEPVWRLIRNDTDPMHSMHLASEVLLTTSGVDRVRASMHHALTGHLLWTTQFPVSGEAQHTGLVDAVLLPPSFAIKETVSVAGAAPDAIVMDRSGRVIRMAGVNGAPVWLSDIAEPASSTEEASIPIKLHSTQSHTFIISLIPHQPKLRLFSTTQTYSLRVKVISSNNGAALTTFDIPHSNVEMNAVSSRDNSAGNVLVLGQDGSSSVGIKPHLVWLQNDGSVRSVALNAPSGEKEEQIDSKSIQIVKSKTAAKYTSLSEVSNLSNRGIFVALTNDDRGDVLRISKAKQELKSMWHFEEDAKDATYTGSVDRKGQAFVNRMFFSSAQHLLNFHVLWVDAHDGEGQVTGFSFQWDHDLNGDVLTAPFEASQVSEFQLVTRAVFVTSSSSIRMIQEDRHQWIREEGLSHTTAAILIDLPESRIGSSGGAKSAEFDAKTLLKGEAYLHRLERHLHALQNLPQYIFTSVWKGVQEIPALSLSSFGIQGIGTGKSIKGADDDDKKKPVATTSSVRTKVERPVKEEDPPPPVALAPRMANATVAKELVRDSFGFRKLIIATSKKGKIYAVDSQTGAHLWEKSLVGFGEGEGAEISTVDVKLLALVRSVGGSGYGALITVVAEVKDKGLKMTRMWEIDPLTGAFPGGEATQTGLALFPGASKDAFLLPIEDEVSGQIATAIIDPNDKIYVWPTTTSVGARFANMTSNFFYTIKEDSREKGQSILVGYTPAMIAGQVKGERAWQLPIPANEEVTSITRPNQDSIASQGKVLGNRKTLYKYLNPHSLVVTTRNVETRSAGVLVVDGITGRILHEASLCQGGLVLDNEDGSDKKIHVVFTENWVTVVFDVKIEATDPLAKYKGAHTQTRLVSIELYELDNTLSKRDETWNWQGKMSSLARSSAGVHSNAIQAYSQLYVLPSSIRGLSTSRTKYGITSKAILLATKTGRIMALPRRLLDPRRPVGRKPTNEEKEEGLMTYDPYIMDKGNWYVGKGKQTPLASQLKTKASLLESLSVVFVHGSLDWWVTKVAPSGTFDLLNESFNKAQLLLTIVVLSAGLLVTKPMVSSKMLRSRW
ncbi:hypothetical protein CBS101457_002351 [Exobasidium rhododendri]|nr:hypothetical protein CBS101457_002351 [Exobasidium rhododendri]